MKRVKERLHLIRPLLVPLIFYIGFLALSTNLVTPQLDQTTAIIMSLLPMIPAAFLAIGLVGAINKLDELEKKIILEAASASFLVTFLGLIALSQLNRVGIHPPDPIYISLLMAILVILAKLAGNWKHK